MARLLPVGGWAFFPDETHAVSRLVSDDHRQAPTTVEDGDQILEDASEFRRLDLHYQDGSRMPGMLEQVLLAPELEREHQFVAVAKVEGQQVVGRGSPLKDPKLFPEQLVLVVSGRGGKPPMSDRWEQAGEGQG
jgi:hypothetical protein